MVWYCMVRSTAELLQPALPVLVASFGSTIRREISCQHPNITPVGFGFIFETSEDVDNIILDSPFILCSRPRRAQLLLLPINIPRLVLLGVLVFVN
jgi:hypothetical protein